MSFPVTPFGGFQMVVRLIPSNLRGNWWGWMNVERMLPDFAVPEHLEVTRKKKMQHHEPRLLDAGGWKA